MAINLDVLHGALAGLVLGGALMTLAREWWAERRARRIARQVMASEGWQECGLGAFGLPPDQQADLDRLKAAYEAAHDEALALAAEAKAALAQPQRTPDMVERVLADLRHYCPLCGETGPGLPWACETHLAHLNGLSPVPIPNHILMIAGPFTRADLN